MINFERLRFSQTSAMFLDLLAWSLAIPTALLIRFDGNFGGFELIEFFPLILISSFLGLAFSQLFQVNSKGTWFGKIDNLIPVFLATTFTGAVLLVIRIVFNYPNLPRSIPLLSAFAASLLQIAFRVIFIGKIIRLDGSNSVSGPNRIIIYGAGSVGHQIAEQLMDYKQSFTIVGFIDDEKSKQKARVLGHKVLGSIADIRKIIDFFRPNTVVIAILDLDPLKLEELRKLSREFNFDLMVLPDPHELVSGYVTLNELSTLTDSDLLNRKSILKSNPELNSFFASKRVLVTGAGGSIGSEIVYQLSLYSGCEVFLLDRDESGLLRSIMRTDAKADLSSERIFLVDIRDATLIDNVIMKIAPEIVFHAAALKHVSILEKFPDEAFKTNVLGTKNIWEASLKHKVPYFINISSDKAANPTTVLGESKLKAERIVASTIESPQIKKYLSVRFGNVIGSNGSFVEVFKHQVAKGGPVTVRHPEVTRYFMTISEAVRLVFESILIGKHRETLILDMGNPIKILDVAKKIIASSGLDIEIEFTHLNPGEKLNEVLYSDNEVIEFRSHPKIMHTRVPPIRESDL